MKNNTNAFSLFWQLFTGKYQPNVFWHEKSYRFKFLFRMLIAPRTIGLLRHLVRFRYQTLYFQGQPNLVCKLQRPYLMKSWPQKAAYEALISHYQLMDAQSETLVRCFYATERTTLIELQGKNETLYPLSIYSSDRYTHEGELNLALFNRADEQLAIMTFAIITYGGQRTLFIGGLQGGARFKNDPDRARTLIQQATKDLHGLFPKRILLQAAYTLAAYFNAAQIVAVSDQSHFYRHWRYRKTIHASYNEFWAMCGGVQDQRKNYILPAELPQKPLEEIASKKRAEYRRRYDLLAQLDHDLTQQLHTLQNKDQQQ